MVLLENRDGTLPLSKSATVALVGPLADAPIDMLGSWSAAGRRPVARGVRDDSAAGRVPRGERPRTSREITCAV